VVAQTVVGWPTAAEAVAAMEAAQLGSQKEVEAQEAPALAPTPAQARQRHLSIATASSQGTLVVRAPRGTARSTRKLLLLGVVSRDTLTK